VYFNNDLHCYNAKAIKFDAEHLIFFQADNLPQWQALMVEEIESIVSRDLGIG
jgi:hypothetical protein